MRQVAIINATGAKQGGAREILRRYIESLDNRGSYRYLVLCPRYYEIAKSYACDNIEFVEKETSGIFTYLFSTVLVAWYAVRFRAAVVISFNNVNVLAAMTKRITYFHQEKAIGGDGVRFALIRLNLRLLKGTSFIVQSERIRRKLIEHLRIDPDNVAAKWPGVRHLRLVERNAAWSELSHLFLPFRAGSITADDKVAFLPVYSTDASHKDFSFFYEMKKSLNEVGYTTVSLCPPGSGIADFDLGLVTTEQMDLLYAYSDILVLISKEETLCLPMFEYAQTGKPVIALEAPYVVEFKKEHPEWLKNTYVIPKDVSRIDLKNLLAAMSPVSVPGSVINQICQGQWDI